MKWEDAKLGLCCERNKLRPSVYTLYNQFLHFLPNINLVFAEKLELCQYFVENAFYTEQCPIPQSIKPLYPTKKSIPRYVSDMY